MIIVKKGTLLKVGSLNIPIMKILFVDNDSKNVYIIMSQRGLFQMGDGNGITIPFNEVTSPQVFTSAQELNDYIADLIPSGLIDGTKSIVLSNTADCVHGFIKVKNTATAGVIKYTTVDGDTDSDTFQPGQVSEFRVRRVWSDGTAVAEASIRILV